MSTTHSVVKMRFTIDNISFDDDRRYIGRAYAGYEQIKPPGVLPYLWQVLDADGVVYADGTCDDPGNFCEDEGAFGPQDLFADWGVVEMQYMPADGAQGWCTL